MVSQMAINNVALRHAMISSMASADKPLAMLASKADPP